ncbi:MAG: hypothetical protein FJ298_15935 [Planctomycetes bacterium]|nr:hypothetical protein [Planctomycetota bacterium]
MERRHRRLAERAAAAALLVLATGCDGGEQREELARLSTLNASAAESARVALERAGQLQADLESSVARVAELEAELRRARSVRNCEQHGEEILRLRAEIAAADERRIAREREWLRFLRNLDELRIPRPSPDKAFVPELPAEELAVASASASAPEPIDEQRLAREAALTRALRALVAVEGLTSLDLLEAGHLGEGWIGPVLFRVLDGRGRLAGSLYGERLRLEGSRAARTLEIVLESGYEMRGGERVAFGPGQGSDGTPIEGGVRRLALLDCDPTRWAEPLGELFGRGGPPARVDDGRWSLVYVKGALNRLLKHDASEGYWRVKSVSGVLDGALREVHLERFDRHGSLESRVFADALRIVRQERGLLLELEGGAALRGEEKTPFLDDRFRIFLPRAVHADWDAAVLPGLSEPDEGAAPPRSG